MFINVTYNDDLQLEQLKNIEKDRDDLSFHFIDSRTRKGKKESFSLKSHWGAKLDPFILVTDNDIPVKAFYSETGEGVIKSLLEYIKDESIMFR